MAPEKLYRNTLIKLQNIDRDNAFSPQYSWREEVGGGGGGEGQSPTQAILGEFVFLPSPQQNTSSPKNACVGG